MGALAMSPDAFAGARRLRLVRAATLSSVMGLAWATAAPGAVLPEPPSTVLSHPEREAMGHLGGGGPFSPLVPPERRDTPATPTKPREKTKKDEEPGKEGRGGGKASATEASAARTEGAKAADKKADTKAADKKADKKPADKKADKKPAPDPDAWKRQVLATRGGVDLIRPARRVRLVGFHEASRWGAEPMVPEHALDAQHGRGTVRVAHPRANPKLHTMILPTRGRKLHPASAIDVAVPSGDNIHAPVTGKVLSVERYKLYGRYPDTRIVIQPKANPRLRVVILHVSEARVRRGDTVKAGRTTIANMATKFPFESQIDRFTKAAIGKATPHVHIEIRSD